ncbi:MAG: hypothetical protein JWN72_2864 [Thermoleophilia bacterium]|nr:hypothetical protein [Thermoleophilia bacterium]
MSSQVESSAHLAATDCAICRRDVLVGEILVPHRDPKSDRIAPICELCAGRARTRGWEAVGDGRVTGGGTRLRVERFEPSDPAPVAAAPVAPTTLTPPQAAILDRAAGSTDAEAHRASAHLVARLRAQELELTRLRRDLDPARRAEEARLRQRQGAELVELRAAVRDRDARIARLQGARIAETSPMRMTGLALDAFNQSPALERMARIARTLGDPVVNLHDEGPGIPRRVRVTLSWDIAWYEFMVKLDLGTGRASVNETGTGGDPAALPLERRRSNAHYRESGMVLA